MNEFDPNKVALNCNLDETVADLGTELKCTLDKLAPLESCSISLRPKMPWYTKKMAQYKAKVRRREKGGLNISYHLAGWHSKHQELYYWKLNNKKKEIIRTQISDNTNNSKKLHALINNLTTKPNPI